VWKNIATTFKSNANVIFDLMNEPHDIDASVVFTSMQAAVTAIRGTGATQLILVEGTSYTGAWTWVSSGNGAAFANLKDPQNNIAIEMHQYLDSDGSGTSDQCVSSTIGAERLQAATQWLQQTGFKGVLGEIGAGSNPTCISAVYGALCSMQTASNSPWIGALWYVDSALVMRMIPNRHLGGLLAHGGVPTSRVSSRLPALLSRASSPRLSFPSFELYNNRLSFSCCRAIGKIFHIECLNEF
jgi:hypothetical protein